MSDITLPENMPGIEAANDLLGKWIAEDQAKEPSPAAETPSTDAPSTDPNRGDQAGNEEVAKQELDALEGAGTSATEDSKKTPEPPKTEVTPDKSRYEKSRERREKSWQELNSEKELVRTAKSAIDNERKAFEAERKAWQEERAKASKPQFGPEDYEKAAEKWEDEGKFDLAEAARNKAADLRKNPPKPPEAVSAERQQQFLNAQREWYAKAAIDFPEVAKTGTPMHSALETFIKSEPDVVQHPKGVYYGARLVAAEFSAARVPALEKELSELRAKVKEFEQLTGPSIPGVPGQQGREKTWAEMSNEEQLEHLERQAREQHTLR